MVKDWGIGFFDGTNFQLLKANNLPKNSVKKMEFLSTGELLILFENNQLYEVVFDTVEEEITISQVALVSDNIREFGILPNQKISESPAVEMIQIF